MNEGRASYILFLTHSLQFIVAFPILARTEYKFHNTGYEIQLVSMIPQKLLTTFLAISISTKTDELLSSNTHDLQGPAHPKQVDVQTTGQALGNQFGVKLEQQQPLTIKPNHDDVSLKAPLVFPVYDLKCTFDWGIDRWPLRLKVQHPSCGNLWWGKLGFECSIWEWRCWIEHLEFELSVSVNLYDLQVATKSCKWAYNSAFPGYRQTVGTISRVFQLQNQLPTTCNAR